MASRTASRLRLKGTAGTLYTSPEAWDELLEAAEVFGWYPAQRRALYRADIGLEISAVDARNLAAALELLAFQVRTGRFVIVPDEHRNELLREVRRFCRYCRAGGFRIC